MATHTAWKSGQPEAPGAIVAAASTADWKDKPNISTAASATEGGIAAVWKTGETSSESAITAWKAGDSTPGEGNVVAWKGEPTGEGPVAAWKGNQTSEAAIQTA